jgi:hypothetical protein
MGDGHASDRLHGLDRHWGFKIEAHKDLEDSKSDENPKGIHLIQSDIANHKRDQGAEIPKGPGKLHPVVVVTPQTHDETTPPWDIPS